METQQIHRGRLIDHLQLVVRDLSRSKRFYRTVAEVLEVPISGEGEDYFWIDELFISSAQSKSAQGMLTGRAHFAFQATSREMVDRFHKAAIAAGGADNGPPGLRPYHPGYYGAFVIDPDQNNIEAVYHGPASRSAPSIVIKF